MTIQTIVKEWVLGYFSGCVKRQPPKEIGVVIVEMMAHVKGTLPSSVNTIRKLLEHLERLITGHFDTTLNTHTVIVCFDLKSTVAKNIMTRPERQDKRCKLCKTTETFHPDCKRKTPCKDVPPPLKFEDGPYFSNNLDDALPVEPHEWTRFAGDSRNLRRELYPRLVNQLLMSYPRRPGQTIYVSGLPFQTRNILPAEYFEECGYVAGRETNRIRVVQWPDEHLTLPLLSDELFNKVFRIHWMYPSPERPNGWKLVTECPEMQHDIHEADNSIFFFTQFFPQGTRLMITINDGDALPIGLLRTAEDFANFDEPYHRVWIRLPYLVGDAKHKAKYGNVPRHRYDYINLTKLYKKISNDQLFVQSGVQNPVATVVLLMILAGTDFFKGYCPGIGYKTDWKPKSTRQKNGIWDTFMEDLGNYSHMIQWYTLDMTRNPTIFRRIVIDYDLFEHFTYKCYFNKYLSNNPSPTLADLRVHCSKSKSSSANLPSKQQIRMWYGWLDHNVTYWANAVRNIYVDAYEKIDGKSYYGFENGRTTADVYPGMREVDEVFSRHFYSQKQKEKQKQTASALISSPKRRRIVSDMKDEVKDI